MSQAAIQFACPSCQTVLKVPVEMAGVSGPCPNCRNTIVAPLQSQQASPAAMPHATPVPQQSQPLPHPIPAQPQAPPAVAPVQQLPPSRRPEEPPRQQTTAARVDPRSINVGSAQSSAPSSSHSSPPARTHRKRRTWPAVVFPVLFLGLSGAVVYLILDLMGVLSPSAQTTSDQNSTKQNQEAVVPDIKPTGPDTTNLPDSPSGTEADKAPPPPEGGSTEATSPPLDHDPRDIEKPGEIPAELPEVAEGQDKKLTQEEVERQERAAFLLASEEILDLFLKAKTLKDRLPYMTKSERTMEELEGGSLNAALPSKLFSRPERAHIEYPNNALGKIVETYYSVAFRKKEGERFQRIIIVRIVAPGRNAAPRVHTDAFLDIYEAVPEKIAGSPLEKGPKNVRVIAELTGLCFDEHVPNGDNKGTVILYPNLAKIKTPFTKAYLDKDSEIFQQLRAFIPRKQQRPVTVTLQWNTTEDPEKPFLEVARLNGLGWTLPFNL